MRLTIRLSGEEEEDVKSFRELCATLRPTILIQNTYPCPEVEGEMHHDAYAILPDMLIVIEVLPEPLESVEGIDQIVNLYEARIESGSEEGLLGDIREGMQLARDDGRTGVRCPSCKEPLGPIETLGLARFCVHCGQSILDHNPRHYVQLCYPCALAYYPHVSKCSRCAKELTLWNGVTIEEAGLFPEDVSRGTPFEDLLKTPGGKGTTKASRRAQIHRVK